MVGTSPIKIRDNILWRIVEEEALIMDVHVGYFYSLNPSATRIWELMAKGTGLVEIRKQLCSQYELTPETAEEYIQQLYVELCDLDVIETESTHAESTASG
jgi:hypothetical protein